MMIKVGSEYISLDQEPVMVKQAKTPDLLGTAGDFSYQFDIQNTSEYRRILGIKSLYTEQFNVDAELINDDGVTVYRGIVNVEGIETYVMHCSFIAGNSDWFTVLSEKKVYDIPIGFLDQYKEKLFTLLPNGIIVTPNSRLVANWDNTEGIVFPLIDMGKLRDWSTDSLYTEDFMPWTFIRHLMKAILDSNGFKLDGDLLNDGLYNQLIVGTTFTNDNSLPFFEGLAIFVGKSGNQTINTVASVVTFTLTSFPYYVGSYNTWAANTYTVPIDFVGHLSIDFDFSGSTTYTIELLVNGVVESTIEGTGAEVSKTFREIGPGLYRPTEYFFNEGDVIQVRAKTAAGSVDILDGATLKMEVVSLQNWYPQFLVGGLTQGDFVKSVFTMFNVISSFDPITKTVTCSLFKNITSNTTDLSQYLDSYVIDTVEILQDLAKQITFKHEVSPTELAQDFNKTTPTPFGGESIELSNRMLTGTKDVETNFTAGMDYFNDLVRASLLDVGGITLTPSGDVKEFASVTNSSGPIFHTVDQDGNPENHGLSDMDVVLITGTSNGEYIGMGYVQAGAAFGLGADEFRMRRMDFVSTATGNWQRVSLNRSTNSDNVFIAVYVPNGPMTNFSKRSSFDYGSSTYTEFPWAYFLKESYSVPYDNMLLTPAFGQTANYKQFPLVDNYWKQYRQSIENAVKVKTTMLLPYVVYENMRFDQAVYLTTEDFTGLFFIQKIEGYVNSYTPCSVDLFRLL